MKRLVLAIVMMVAIPLAGRTMDLSVTADAGAAKANLAQRLETVAAERGAAQDSGHAFQISLAPAAFFSLDHDLNQVVSNPAWGADLAFIYWLSRFGLGLSGQYFSSTGSGTVDHFKVDARFEYYNIFLNFYGKFIATDKISLYGVTGIGYSNASLKGTSRDPIGFFPATSFNQNDSGAVYKAGLGVQAPWLFSELLFTESSFSRGKNEKGQTEVAVLDAFQLLLGMRTP